MREWYRRSVMARIVRTVLLIVMPGLGVPSLVAQEYQSLYGIINGRDEIRVRRSAFDSWFSIRNPTLQTDSIAGVVQTGEVRGSAVTSQMIFDLSDLQEIKIRSGTRVLEGTGLGAGFGLVLVMTLHLVCINDPLCRGPTTVGYPALYAMSIGGSAVVGSVWGSLTPAWRTIYKQGIPRVEVTAGPTSGLRSLALRVAVRW